MIVHSLDTIKRLKELREEGCSINELVELLGIPKTTVWHHIHKVRIPTRHLRALNAKRGGSAKRKQKNWELARLKAQELLSGPHRDLAIALAMLYWGEGSKKVCEFINSDGRMITLYLHVLKEVFKIAEERIKPTMRIFSGMDKKECLSYWSHATGMPKGKFLIRFNDGGTRGKTRYGMCRITVKKGADVLKLIHSLINQFSQQVLAMAPS